MPHDSGLPRCGAQAERPLLRDTGAAREAGRRRPGLARARAAPAGARRARRRAARRPRATPSASADRADPEDDRSARAHERQAPLGRGRRLRERLRDRDAGPVGRLLLGATPDDARVRRREPLEERALAPLGLEQHHLAVGKRMGERDPGCAAAASRRRRSGPSKRRDELERRRASRRAAPAGPPPRRGAPSARASRRRAASQPSSGEDDDVAIRLRSLARRLHAGERP